MDATISLPEASATRWDVIVVGAGPGGSVAATMLARRGVRTLLLDRVALPRHKVCGCCLAPRGARALQGAGLGAALRGARPLTRLSLRLSGRTISAPLSGYVTIGRDTLDERLAIMARDAGASVMWPAPARVGPDGQVDVLWQGVEHRLEARAILCADGLGGSSARGAAGAAWRERGAWGGNRIGCGTVVEDAPLEMRAAELVMLCEAEGYLGLARLPDGRINAAAAFDPMAVREHKGPGPLAERFVQRAGGRGGMLGAARWTGTPTLTRRRENVSIGQMLMVGDASGYVEPFTGEGMAWAIAGALAAAPVAERMARGVSDGLEWREIHRRLFAKRHARCGVVAGALRIGPLRWAAARVGEAGPALTAATTKWVTGAEGAFAAPIRNTV